jgi:hypothetical protein
MIERMLLGAGLPLGGMIVGFLSAGAAIWAGLREPSVSVAGFAGMVVGIVGASRFAVGVVSNARRFSLSRRIAAGVVGLTTLMAVGRCLPFLGLDPDALSHSPSPWAVVEEALSMLIGYGSMLTAASAALARPNVADDTVVR